MNTVISLVALLGACLIAYLHLFTKHSPGRMLWDGRAREEGLFGTAWFCVGVGLLCFIALIAQFILLKF